MLINDIRSAVAAFCNRTQFEAVNLELGNARGVEDRSVLQDQNNLKS